MSEMPETAEPVVIPPSAKKPQDRKEKKPKSVREEAKLEDITVEFRGETFTIPGENIDNLELFELIEDQFVMRAMRGFLGRDEWDRFKNHIRTPDGRVPLDDANAFMQKIMDAVGNQNASPRS